MHVSIIIVHVAHAYDIETCMLNFTQITLIIYFVSGGYELQIVSQPFGRFYIHADLGPRTSGKEIIQKVSGYTDLPSSLIKLYTRLAEI